MKLVCLNDVHLSHRGPQSRTDDWQEAIFGKLDQVSKVAKKVNARAVCIAGDIFHHKSRIAYHTVFRLIMWALDLKRHRIDVLTIPGNHDEVHDRLESVETQPIGLLFASGAFRDVSYQPIRYDGAPGDGSMDVQIVGVPYPDAMNFENFQKAADARIKECAAGRALLMAHCFATPEGGTYFGQQIHAYAAFRDLPFDVFHFGHDHSDHGVAVMEGKFFINIGAISRGSLAMDDLKREPKIALVEFTGTEGVKVQQIKLKVTPINEVFDLALKAQKDREKSEVEAFVGQLHDDLALAGPIEFKDRLKTMALPEVVRTRVQAYLDSAEASLREM